MLTSLKKKEIEVELSRLKHNILETELKIEKKKEDIFRLEDSINHYKKLLEDKLLALEGDKHV